MLQMSNDTQKNGQFPDIFPEASHVACNPNILKDLSFPNIPTTVDAKGWFRIVVLC